MVTRSHVFASGEWYHCYSRGVEKRTIFETKADYERFLALIYVANARPTIHRSNLGKRTLVQIFKLERKDTLTGIGAFCLMPNHVHLLLKETEEGGISTFMRKLLTGYSMYFNIRHKHEGNLFTHPYRSKHVSDDRYFQQVVSYIHFNPAELSEPRWKDGVVKNQKRLERSLIEYPYSSLSAFRDKGTPLRHTLDESVFSAYEPKDLTQEIGNARAYHSEWQG